MRASEKIKSKLKKNGGSAFIELLRGNKTDLYFVTENTYWSKGLGNIIGRGYKMFDILEDESFRFPKKSIPKGNARNYKLGQEKCDIHTAAGILGYKYYNKEDGDSIYDPMHIVSAILDWADVAKNVRGYIVFE
jgi:hypothetical protein